MLDNYDYLKAEVLKLTKIDLNYYKEKQMRRRIDTLITKNKKDSYEDYIALIKKDQAAFQQFVNFLTINVSEFYRNPEQWKLLDKQVLPKLIGKEKRALRVWSAACSTGDEPYSLVMALSKYFPLSNIHVLATDIDKTVIAQAKVGLYSAKSLQGIPEEFKKRYFTKIGDSYQIDEAIKECVSFKEHNLLKENYPSGFDLILCRNVVIYFTDEAKDQIYHKFYDSLNPGGILFIGSTEQITNYKGIGFKRFSSFFFEKPGA